MVSPPHHQAPSHPKGKCCFGVTLLPGPLPILLMLGKLCPRCSPKNAQNQLGILVELRRFGRMHGAREEAELIVGILHRAHNTQYVGLFLKISI